MTSSAENTGKSAEDQKLRVLIVDDDTMTLDTSLKLLEKMPEFANIDVSSIPSEALQTLIASQAKEYRDRVHLLLADIQMPNGEDGVAFLNQVRGIPGHPYTIVHTGRGDDEVLRGISDGIIIKGNGNFEDEVRAHLSRCNEYWKRISKNETGSAREHHEEIEELPETAPLSPLPAIRLDKFNPDKDNHNLLETQCEEKYWLGMVDLDNTLYEAESKHSIILHSFAKFLKEKSNHNFENDGGSPAALKELIDYCDNWEEERKHLSQGRDIIKPPIRYEKGLVNSGNLSAAAFEGMTLAQLKKYGKEFVQDHLSGKFFEYTPDVIQKMKDHGILPVLVTGAPDFLVPFILEKLDMNHGNGMTYKLDADGNLTGEIEINMGLAAEKADIGQKHTNAGHAVSVSIGDSVADTGLFKCATHKSLAKWDVSGGAIMVNGSEDAEAEIRRNYANEIRGGRVRIVDAKAPTFDVVNALALVLRKTFEPMHEYVSLKRDTDRPEKLEAFLDKLKALDNEYKKIENIENIKKIRDLWEQRGASKQAIRRILERFYPPSVVVDTLKSNVINTRNPDDLGEFLEGTTLNRELIREVVAHVRLYHEERGSLAPKLRKRQTTTPGNEGEE